MHILRNILSENICTLVLIPHEKENLVSLLCHIYMRTRVAVLCYPGSVCQWWMTEIMWFLSILILTGVPFQKGQEWQCEKFSRECLRTCLKTWSSLTHSIVLGCWGKAAPGELRTWSGIQTSRTTKLACQAQYVRLWSCWNHAGEDRLHWKSRTFHCLFSFLYV